MLPLDPLSPEAASAFAKSGAGEEAIIATVTLDLDEGGDYGRCVLALTSESILSVSAKPSAPPETKAAAHAHKHSEAAPVFDFASAPVKAYPVAEAEEPYIESFLSTNRFYIKINGTSIGVAYCTNSTKQKLFAFVEILKRIKKGKETKDDDPLFEQFNTKCPKCGTRYERHSNKICMNCVDKNKMFVRLFKYFKGYGPLLGLVFVCMLFNSGISLVMPYLNNKIFIDHVLNPDSAHWIAGMVVPFVVFIFCVDMVSSLVGIARSRSINKMSIFVTRNMKQVTFAALQRLSLAYFNNNQTGRLMNRVRNDPETIRSFYTDTIPSFIINVVTFIGVTVAMFIINWKLTLIVFLPVPAIIWIFSVKIPVLQRLLYKRWRRASAMNAMLGDSLNGIRVVKAFAKEAEETNRFHGYNERVYEANLKINLTQLTISPVVQLLISLTGSMIWGFGGTMVFGRELTFGELLTYLSYIGMIFGPLQFFSGLTSQLAEIATSATRMFEILDTPADVVNSGKPVPIDGIGGKIEFSDVNFHYLANRPILHNMSFTIEQGQYIGLVGHTGAGKSTIANLITRMYDVVSGSIKIDGHNIKDIDVDLLRRSIAIVSQEIFIFRGTVAENIRYARPNATTEEVIDAAKAANAHDFIVNLPHGYETLVGTGSRSMSGGEQQRISIARALLLDPRILILDEATAAMDTETERMIQNAVNLLVKGRTTLVIAHRLSTLRECEYLYAVDNGEIAEHGTHAELIAKKGIYYRLYKLQSDAMKRVIGTS